LSAHQPARGRTSDVRVVITLIDAPAREHRGTADELHVRVPAHQEDVDARGLVPDQHHGGRRPGRNGSSSSPEVMHASYGRAAAGAPREVPPVDVFQGDRLPERLGQVLRRQHVESNRIDDLPSDSPAGSG
jgi:hypothetical protein